MIKGEINHNLILAIIIMAGLRAEIPLFPESFFFETEKPGIAVTAMGENHLLERKLLVSMLRVSSRKVMAILSRTVGESVRIAAVQGVFNLIDSIAEPGDGQGKTL